jgi:DNA-binding CsgD family transcriptional regulator
MFREPKITIDQLFSEFGLSRHNRGDNKQLADILGVHPVTISQWIAEDMEKLSMREKAVLRLLSIGYHEFVESLYDEPEN